MSEKECSKHGFKGIKNITRSILLFTKENGFILFSLWFIDMDLNEYEVDSEKKATSKSTYNLKIKDRFFNVA